MTSREEKSQNFFTELFESMEIMAPHRQISAKFSWCERQIKNFRKKSTDGDVIRLTFGARYDTARLI
jgi:hypothetical protein